MMSASARIDPALRLEYALRIRNAYPIAGELSGGQISEPRALLPPQFSPDMDLADFLFTTVVQHIDGSADQLAAIEALDRLDVGIRNRFIDAIGAIYDGPSVFVNSGWSHDQTEDRDMTSALNIYDNIKEITDPWGRPDVTAEIWCARSVILDEGLDQKDAALAAIDDAVKALGSLPTLIRQKAKVFSHLDRHSEATDLLLSIEDTIGTGTSLERGLALRDGGISAGKAGRFSDAIRLFDKAHKAFLANPDNAPLAAGVLVEKALGQWRADRKGDAIVTAADVCDAVAQFEPIVSRQAERSHQFARALVGLMSMESPPIVSLGSPPFTFGQASSLDASAAKLLGVSLKPLADNWRILSAVEAQSGVALGIDERSMAKQNGPLLLGIERLILAHRYVAVLKGGPPGEALLTGAKLVATVKLAASVPPDAEGNQRASLTMLEAGTLAEDIVDPSLGDLVQSLVLDLLALRVLEGAVDTQAIVTLRAEVAHAFGLQPQFERMFDAASQLYVVGAEAGRGPILASGIAVPGDIIAAEPTKRFLRDVMLVVHAVYSMGRGAFEQRVAALVVSGWTSVITDQRFLLKNPAMVASNMQPLIENTNPPTLSTAAAVLLCAKDAVPHNFADGWFDILASLATKNSSQVA